MSLLTRVCVYLRRVQILGRQRFVPSRGFIKWTETPKVEEEEVYELGEEDTLNDFENTLSGPKAVLLVRDFDETIKIFDLTIKDALDWSCVLEDEQNIKKAIVDLTDHFQKLMTILDEKDRELVKGKYQPKMDDAVDAYVRTNCPRRGLEFK
ncbi:hypothetical protein NDN08_003905 [Rhodosorus marinus]|uniref:ATP synthase subunit d, mitochondrial n=1 Tax=Rhodosorus marinus TaxID=101924 RepID=A0AAV8UGT5_9RHOD|nr:hypothetical protein NDN08_003905 [Rhodosorus marinus]